MTPAKPPLIVLVEDNPADTYLLRTALEAQGEGYEIEVITDGQKALLFVQEYHRSLWHSTPCVSVLDWYLPKHDGAEVLRAISQQPVLSGVPVLILSGLVSPRQQAVAKDLGVQIYLNKPVDPDGYETLAKEIITACKEHVFKGDRVIVRSVRIIVVQGGFTNRGNATKRLEVEAAQDACVQCVDCVYSFLPPHSVRGRAGSAAVRRLAYVARHRGRSGAGCGSAPRRLN
jgi:CheY-like chemotaxis protein